MAGASALHCTGMTNWPKTIQRLGSDDITSLGVKSAAFLRVEHPFSRKLDMSSTCGYVGEFFWNVVSFFLTCPPLVGILGQNNSGIPDFQIPGFQIHGCSLVIFGRRGTC